MKNCMLVGSDKGGVGKSLLSQILIVSCVHSGIPLRLSEIDHSRKLSSIFPDMDILSVPPVRSASPVDRRSPFNFADVYEEWMKGDSLTDLGANVTTPLFDWMQRGGVSKLAEQDEIRFSFVAVSSADEQAIRSAAESLQKARDALGQDASLFLVLNAYGTSSDFHPYEGMQVWKDLMQRSDRQAVRTIRIPYCQSGILEYGRARGCSIADLLDPKRRIVDQICQDAGYNRLERHFQYQAFMDWVEEVQTAVHPLFEILSVEDGGNGEAGSEDSKVLQIRTA